MNALAARRLILLFSACIAIGAIAAPLPFNVADLVPRGGGAALAKEGLKEAEHLWHNHHHHHHQDEQYQDQNGRRAFLGEDDLIRRGGGAALAKEGLKEAEHLWHNHHHHHHQDEQYQDQNGRRSLREQDDLFLRDVPTTTNPGTPAAPVDAAPPTSTTDKPAHHHHHHHKKLTEAEKEAKINKQLEEFKIPEEKDGKKLSRTERLKLLHEAHKAKKHAAKAAKAKKLAEEEADGKHHKHHHHPKDAAKAKDEAAAKLPKDTPPLGNNAAAPAVGAPADGAPGSASAPAAISRRWLW